MRHLLISRHRNMTTTRRLRNLTGTLTRVTHALDGMTSGLNHSLKVQVKRRQRTRLS